MRLAVMIKKWCRRRCRCRRCCRRSRRLSRRLSRRRRLSILTTPSMMMVVVASCRD